jgi:hypothetical protein
MDNEKDRSAYGPQSKVDRAYLCMKRLRGFANCACRDAWGTHLEYTGNYSSEAVFLHQAGEMAQLLSLIQLSLENCFPLVYTALQASLQLQFTLEKKRAQE